MRGEAVESLRAETDILKGEGEQGRAQGNRSRVFVQCRRVEGAEGRRPGGGREPRAMERKLGSAQGRPERTLASREMTLSLCFVNSVLPTPGS